MRTLAPPVPERFDDMPWVMWLLYGVLCVVLVVFWGAVLLALLG
jgi:hypothetical protein